ncbi:Potassium channel AKT1 [Symbiodinium microadriaticum]|uniref:Potassium channel AKT1 n=1 Tax=Symbiodinium microadriaticum TaxID=2951 RepID=A0A1Q9CXN8_SYMMI|nr:Potassium channel AKT1 [Symbiodinium microadriaticum]
MASSDGGTSAFWDIHQRLGELHTRLAECYQMDMALRSRQLQDSDEVESVCDRHFHALERGRRSSEELQLSPGPLVPARIFTDSSVSGVVPLPETTSSARMLTPMTPGAPLFSLIPSTPQTPALNRSVTAGSATAGANRVPSHQQGLAVGRANNGVYSSGGAGLPTRKTSSDRSGSRQEELAVFQTKFDDDRKVAQQNFAKMERVVSKKPPGTLSEIRQCFVISSDRPKRLSMQARGGGQSQTQNRLDKVSEIGGGRHCQDGLARRFVLTPGSKARAVFDAFRMICVILDITIIPLNLFDMPSNATLHTISLLTLTFWTLDIFVSFRTAYFEKGSLVFDSAKIAWHYLSRWLLFDLTVVTLDIVLESSAAGRVGRLLKWNQMFASIRENIDSQMWITRVSIMNILCQILLMYHVVACSYWGLGRMNVDSANWITEYSLQDRSFGYQYTTTLHWAVCQLGLGSNIIEATNFAERVFCIVVVLIALVTFSSLVSLMTSQLTSLHNVQEEEQQQFRLLRSFLLRNHIDRSLSQRVTKFLQHSYTIQREVISDSQVPLLAHLSKNLQGELQYARYQKSLSSMAFVEALEGQDLQNTQILHDMAVQATAQSVLLKGEVVFYAGNLAEHCFIAASGELEYCQGPLQVCKSPEMQLHARKFAEIYVADMKTEQTSSDLWTMPGSEDETPPTRDGSLSPKNVRKSTPTRLFQNFFGAAKRRTSVRRVSLLPDEDEVAQLQALQHQYRHQHSAVSSAGVSKKDLAASIRSQDSG